MIKLHMSHIPNLCNNKMLLFDNFETHFGKCHFIIMKETKVANTEHCYSCYLILTTTQLVLLNLATCFCLRFHQTALKFSTPLIPLPLEYCAQYSQQLFMKTLILTAVLVIELSEAWRLRQFKESFQCLNTQLKNNKWKTHMSWSN